MKTIWKFELAVTDSQTVMMPEGAHVLCIQVQGGGDVPQIWAAVDTEAERVRRHFRTFGTGHPLSGMNAPHYVGTYQIRGGTLVFHVFEDAS
jgi:hypothetical protein